MSKFLIIRFSSIGDIIQCMGVIDGIKRSVPDAEIHWVTRKDMSSILSIDSRIDKVWAFDQREGVKGLLKLSSKLKDENFDYIYDAHNNIRSFIVKSKLKLSFLHTPKFTTRSKDRFKRVLLFKFGINRFDWPFRGVQSYRDPLSKWGITEFSNNFSSKIDWEFNPKIVDRFQDLVDERSITLVPSANWEMKRWPVSHWRELIEKLPEYKFIILGGPSDAFCEDIAAVAPKRTLNLAGKTSLMESCYIVMRSNVVVSADTGFMHAADMFSRPTIALLGPTAFGFPIGESVEIFEIELPCRPCTKDGRGCCKQAIYQKCMVDITAISVANRIKELLPL